ncbi:MAG: hypothetical protein ACOC6S_02330 [Chloroflexota bacterium]
MRKAVMGLGGVVSVVGIVLLIVSMVLVGGVSIETEPVNKAMNDVNKTLTDVADALDNTGGDLGNLDGDLSEIEGQMTDTLDDAVTLLEDLDPELANAEDDVVGTIDDVIELLDQTDGGLGQVEDLVADAETLVSNADDTVQSWEGYQVEIPSESFDEMAAWLEAYDYVPVGEDVADYLESTDGAIDLWPMSLTAGELDAIADEMEAVNIDASWVRDWVDYLEAENAVLAYSASDLNSQINSVEKATDNASQSIENVSQNLKDMQADLEGGQETGVSILSDADDFLGKTTTNVKSLEDTGLKAISDVRGLLGNAQTELSTISSDLRGVSEDIEAADISGTINETVDWLNGIISSLKLYMVISSIMFILVGAGMVLTGFYWGRMQP